MILKKKQHGQWNNSSNYKYLIECVLFNICFFFCFICSDYVNKYLSLSKNLEENWVLNILPVSKYYNKLKIKIEISRKLFNV